MNHIHGARPLDDRGLSTGGRDESRPYARTPSYHAMS